VSKNKILSIFIVFFLIGVFIAPIFSFDERVLFLGFFLLFFLILIFWKNLVVKLTAFSAIFLVLGFWWFYYSLPQFNENFISTFNGKGVEAEGFISSYPQEKDKNETFTVKAEKIKIKGEWKDVKGKIFVLTSKFKEFGYGEKVKLKGILEKIENSPEFKFGEYFASRRIYSKMIIPEIKRIDGFSGNPLYSFLFKARAIFEKKVDEIFVEPFSSLVLGINLGVKRAPSDLLEVFNIVSLSHIIVISGYNLSVIVNFFKGIFQGFSRRLAFWLPLSAIILFTFFVGAEPPVVRAAIMAGILLFARKKGRRASGVFSLLFAAFLMVLINPFLLRYDVGFQLSFLATLGLILISEKIDVFIKGFKAPPVLSEALSSTLSAQIFILPLLIFYFGRLSLIAPIANLLVLPTVPFIMFSSFAVTMVGFLSLEVARFLSLIPFFLLFYLVSVSEFLSKIPFASLSVEKSGVFVTFYYFVLSAPFLMEKPHAKKS